ncbi:hypothetical protein CPB84DRAFT_1340596 [Gymnopilus junonius]|uniref:Uncharacterized protein n=1 Tax=Gymnopilus junonius TaxID=109634 RepID=A0A9P5TLR2_GYMJU|nr:hypothetical protein CPB84DRAFT_1340596 [Gymnopilus junonius]
MSERQTDNTPHLNIAFFTPLKAICLSSGSLGFWSSFYCFLSCFFLNNLSFSPFTTFRLNVRNAHHRSRDHDQNRIFQATAHGCPSPPFFPSDSALSYHPCHRPSLHLLPVHPVLSKITPTFAPAITSPHCMRPFFTCRMWMERRHSSQCQR